MNLKLSRYTLVTPHGGSRYLSSTATGAMVRINGGSGDLNGLGIRSPKNAAGLLRAGILVEEGRDEVAVLRQRYQSDKKARQTICVIVIPSYACNCACPDCYQTGFDSTTRFDATVWRGLSAFLGHMLATAPPAVLAVYFYGGEPLLRARDAAAFVDQLRPECDRRGVQLHLIAASNGAALGTPDARDFASRLDEFYVSMCQSKGEQASRRPLLTGGNSYDRTVAGLGVLARMGKGIRVRINVSNVAHLAADLQRTLSDLRRVVDESSDRVSFEFSLLRLRTSDCTATLQAEDRDEIASMYKQVNQALPSLPWPANRFMIPPAGSDRAVKAAYRGRLCSYLKGARFIIAPDGRFHLCNSLKHVPRYSLMHVSEYPKLFENSLYQRLLDYSPFDDPVCQNCEFLPLCLDKCYLPAVENGGTFHVDGCKAKQRRAVESRVRELLQS